MSDNADFRKMLGITEPTYPTLADLTNLGNVVERTRTPRAFPFSEKMSAEMSGIISRFERCIWFDGFQTMNRAASFRGYRMDLGHKGELLTYTMCGRVMVTLRQGDSEFSFVLDESSDWPRGGVQSASGDLDVIHALMGEAVVRWRAGKRPVEAPSVGLG